MDLTRNIILYLHIACGFFSLALFWFPVFTRKGNYVHRLTGKWYVYMMTIVVLTAAILSIFNVYYGNESAAVFLGFLSLLTATPLWYGVAILKNKRQISKGYLQKLKSFHLLLVVSGAAVIIFSFTLAGSGFQYILLFFGIIGLTSIRDLLKLKNIRPSEWEKTHYGGMIISGIAAYTAFAAFGGRQFFEGLLEGNMLVIPWILPTLIGITSLRILNRKHAKEAKAT